MIRRFALCLALIFIAAPVPMIQGKSAIAAVEEQAFWRYGYYYYPAGMYYRVYSWNPYTGFVFDHLEIRPQGWIYGYPMHG